MAYHTRSIARSRAGSSPELGDDFEITDIEELTDIDTLSLEQLQSLVNRGKINVTGDNVEEWRLKNIVRKRWLSQHQKSRKLGIKLPIKERIIQWDMDDIRAESQHKKTSEPKKLKKIEFMCPHCTRLYRGTTPGQTRHITMCLKNPNRKLLRVC